MNINTIHKIDESHIEEVIEEMKNLGRRIVKIYQNRVVWQGSAEVNHRLNGEYANDSLRVPVALVETPKIKKLKTLVQWEGKWIPARQVGCREFEDENGELLINSDPVLAAKIEVTLK